MKLLCLRAHAARGAAILVGYITKRHMQKGMSGNESLTSVWGSHATMESIGD